MKNILYVSMCLPYQAASHAGGKTVFFYMNRFAGENDIKVKVVCKVRESERGELLKQYDRYELYPICMPTDKIRRLFAYAGSGWSKVNPLNRYGNTLTAYIYAKFYDMLSHLKEIGFRPDAIILEWTEMVLYVDKVKNLFPDAYIVASEHDVKFQSLYRKYALEKNPVKRIYRYILFKNMEERELDALAKADLVVVQSEKDKAILEDNGIPSDKQTVILPFYMNPASHWSGLGTCNIAMFGDMGREENYMSAMWFIENVFEYLPDKGIGFYIIGGRPDKKLLRYQSERIIVTGFVDDVFAYLDKCFCMVAPLQLGAGIKVKCLEAISYGMPLLANQVAIEGIDARDGEDFLFCEDAESFKNNVLKLYRDVDLQRSLSRHAISYGEIRLDLDKSYEIYVGKLREGWS